VEKKMTKIDILKRALESLEFVVGDLDYLYHAGETADSELAILWSKSAMLEMLIQVKIKKLSDD